MKKIRILSLVTVAALMLAAVPAVSAGAPAGTWVSGIACQNLDGANIAHIVVSFYPTGSSTSALDYPDTIPAGGSRNYYTPSSPVGLPASFLGSAVVSSDVPLACNINTQVAGSGTLADPYRMATSGGFDDTQVASTMYAPQVMKNLAGTWNSYIAVQNTTGADVAVTVTYKDRFGADVPAATEHNTIKAFSNKVFYQNDNAGLTAPFIGAATITADDGTSKLAVMVNFYNSASNASAAQFQSYSGFPGGANKLFVPRFVRNYYGYNSGISIQNVGGGPTTVTIAFTFAGNTYNYTSGTINQGAALALYATDIAPLAPVDALANSLRFGGATITAAAGGQVVAIVNEDNRGGAGIPAERAGQGSTYNAIADGSQTNTVFFAQVTRRAGGIFSGGFQVMNTTGNPGTCDVTFNGYPGATLSAVSLPANGSYAKYAPDVAGLADGFNSSVSVTCTQPIVGISNLAVGVGTGKYGDSATTANGLNK